MFTPELEEFDDYLNRFSPKDRRFLETVQHGLYRRPLRSKIGEKVLSICNDSRASKGLLVCAVRAISAGFILGSPEIFTGGICLSSLWQTSNWASHWRDLFIVD